MICILQGALGRQPKPPQHLVQIDDGCRGGSLPNVKFASNNSIDLQVVILSAVFSIPCWLVVPHMIKCMNCRVKVKVTGKFFTREEVLCTDYNTVQ